MTVAELIKLLVDMPMNAQIYVLDLDEDEGYVKVKANKVVSVDDNEVTIYASDNYSTTY